MWEKNLQSDIDKFVERVVLEKCHEVSFVVSLEIVDNDSRFWVNLAY